MNKLYIAICTLFITVLFSVTIAELDDMLQLESLFNLDIEQGVTGHNNVVSITADERELLEGETTAEAVVVTSVLTSGELELELAKCRQEVVRLTDIVSRILVANRRERSTIQYNMGCVYRSAGRHTDAVESFLKALDINPDDPAIHYNLGILYDENLKLPAKARKHYRRFLSLAPNDKDAGKVYEWITELE